ncbi:MAG TPA: efflux RND transporter periplasmic adaptor subunit [Acidobacteriaceae bacterium]|nr:efflux RND transporter periplasmic adaptor subunit [Acidobacteriaceae bacterium]
MLAAMMVAIGLAVCGCNSGSTNASAAAAAAQPSAPTVVDCVKVVSRRLDITIPLPGELQPYEEVRIFPKVSGFVKWIGVDRGSTVKQGQLLAVLVAPEIVAQKSEAEAKVLSAENQRIAVEAKLAADESSWERLKEAARTPGVISDEELEVAEKAATADRARVVALRNTADAARASLRSASEMESYLRITAPFDGVVTKRNVHPGALIGPGGSSGTQPSMMRIEQVAHLRLVVAVPEVYVAGIQRGEKINFTVPAFPQRTFNGTVARLADSIDVSTRTMPVEMDVWNPGLELHSGMFPSILWPVRRASSTLFVPQSAVGRNMEQSYVVTIRDGKAEQVSVKTGAAMNGMTEVFGTLQVGDEVALHATDELRSGMAATPHLVDADAQ